MTFCAQDNILIKNPSASSSSAGASCHHGPIQKPPTTTTLYGQLTARQPPFSNPLITKRPNRLPTNLRNRQLDLPLRIPILRRHRPQTTATRNHHKPKPNRHVHHRPPPQRRQRTRLAPHQNRLGNPLRCRRKRSLLWSAAAGVPGQRRRSEEPPCVVVGVLGVREPV